MKRFCIGLFKTGTTSYSRAMHRLGLIDLHFPPKYLEQLHQQGVRPWTVREWDSMSNVHELEYPECDHLYPDSQFILTTRDVEGWLKSIEHHMRAPWSPHLQAAFDLRFQHVFGVPCRGNAFDAARFRRVFRQHDQAVRDYFAESDRLLVLDLDSGEDLMQKLSDFVGTLPAYPHVNKRGKQHRPGEPVVISLGRRHYDRVS